MEVVVVIRDAGPEHGGERTAGRLPHLLEEGVLDQAVPLAEPFRLTREPQYGGCTSWVQLPATAALGDPVHDTAALAGIAARVRAAVA